MLEVILMYRPLIESNTSRPAWELSPCLARHTFEVSFLYRRLIVTVVQQRQQQLIGMHQLYEKSPHYGRQKHTSRKSSSGHFESQSDISQTRLNWGITVQNSVWQWENVEILIRYRRPLKILSEIPYIKSILMIKNGIIEYIKKGLNNKKRLMLGYCTNTTRNKASKDLCRQPWECFHTWTQESGSASERQIVQHRQIRCVHKLASANLSVWNYFTQAAPLKEIR